MIRIKDLFAKAAALGQSAAAITDHGNNVATWAAQRHADEAGVKFIVGQEFYLAVGSRWAKNAIWVPAEDNSTDEDSERGDEKVDTQLKDGLKSKPYMHLTVIARTAAGWRNLVQLNNKAQESNWHKPRIDFELLAEHSEGLIVLTGCLGGPVLGPMSRRAHWASEAANIPAEYAQLAATAHVESLRSRMADDVHGVTEARQILSESEPVIIDGEAVAPTDDEVKALATEVVEQRQAELGLYATEQGMSTLRARLHEARHRELMTLSQDMEREARSNLQAIIDAVGIDNTHVEIMEHGITHESMVLPDVVALAHEFGVGIVATNDAHYTSESDADAHAGWLLVQSKSTVDNPKYQFHGHGFWLRSEAEMRALRPEQWWQDACDMTQVIADRCEDRVLPAPRNLMPRFPTPDGFANNREYLFTLLRDGAAKLFGGIDASLRERVLAEMDVIDSAGMADYFLVVHDLISWARSTRPSRPGGPEKKPILVGPGRGSAGGSMVAYLLGITQINPVRYGLVFERFYEKGRSEPPDIDIDFPQGRRQEVIQYLRDRWGAENVASIGTVGMELSKKAIPDAARVLGHTKTGTEMKALVPVVQAKPMPVRDLLDADNPSTAEYRRLYDRDDVVRRVHTIAATFEEIVSGFGIHASGIIVSAEPLGDLVPMRKKDGSWVLQWTGPEAEQFGLLKVDVLGLRNLDIIDRAVEYIQETTDEFVDPLSVPDPDQPVAGVPAQRVAAAWKLIGEGRTPGVFQMESPKMTELAMQVSPKRLDEESAIVALYRPGPMGMGAHTSYANRKRGLEPADYSVFTRDPREEQELAKVLGETFGLIVYQEQVMALGTVMAGFDATGRSKLRKAVSKKKKSDLEAIQPVFFEQATRELRDPDGTITSIAFDPVTVQAVWDTLLVFAEYAFNKAHSATYGYLAYMTAFYKANWPAAYAAANLSVTDDKPKRLQVLASLRDEGITVLPPDVNSVHDRTYPDGPMSIRFGISEVKDLGSVGALIVEERRANGEFTSLRDVYSRVQKPDGGGGSAVSAGILKALIGSGAADQFGPRLGQMAVVGAITAREVEALPMEWGVLERSARQREALLNPLGEHPLVALRDQVRQVSLPSLTGHRELETKPLPVASIPDVDGTVVSVLGVLASWTEKAYSRGRFANVTIEGSNALVSGAIWDKTLSEIKDADGVPNVGDIVIVKARVRFRVIAADPDDPGSEETSVKELSINSVRSITVKDPSSGGFPPSALPRLDLSPLETLVVPDSPEFDGEPMPDEQPAADEQPMPEEQHTNEQQTVVEDVPMVLDFTFDTVTSTPAAPTQYAPARTAVLETQPPATVAPATPPTAHVPATQDMEIAGMLVEADIAQGGAGIVTHVQPAHAPLAVLEQPPVASGWEAQLVDAPVDGVPVFAGWLIQMAILTAGERFPGVSFDLKLANLVEAAIAEDHFAHDIVHVLVCQGGVPQFVLAVGE
jgi:DNA polymerase-3 subunit alpha